jgi:micrococcal nuclease
MSEWPSHDDVMRYIRRKTLAALIFWLVLWCLLVGLLVASAHAQSKSRPLKHPPQTVATKTTYIRCTDPVVYDGDTIKCAEGYRVRLLGIQAPEIKCKPGMDCIPGDALAAKASLQLGLQQGPLAFRYIRRDKYGRPVAIVTAGDINLSCWQMTTSDTVYRAAMDYRNRIQRTCGKDMKLGGQS